MPGASQSLRPLNTFSHDVEYTTPAAQLRPLDSPEQQCQVSRCVFIGFNGCTLLRRSRSRCPEQPGAAVPCEPQRTPSVRAILGRRHVAPHTSLFAAYHLHACECDTS